MNNTDNRGVLIKPAQICAIKEGSPEQVIFKLRKKTRVGISQAKIWGNYEVYRGKIKWEALKMKNKTK